MGDAVPVPDAVPHRAGVQPHRRPRRPPLRHPGGGAVSAAQRELDPGRRGAVRGRHRCSEVDRPAHVVPHAAGPGAGRRRRVVHARARQGARHRRRVRLRQDRAHPLDHGAARRLAASTARARSASTARRSIGLAAKQMRHLWGREMSMIFQDPMTSLNPLMKIGKQITEPLKVHLDMDAQRRRRETAERLLARRAHPRGRSAGSTSTRTSCRAACASG